MTMTNKEIWKGEPSIYGVIDDDVEARRWTNASRDCYMRKCKCGGCSIEKIFRQSREESPLDVGPEYRCRCKAVVVKLIRTIGLPDVNTDYSNDTLADD